MISNIIQWGRAPVFPDEEKMRAAGLLNSILWIFISASVSYGLFAPLDTDMRWRRAIIIVPFVLILIGLKQLVNRGYVRATSNLTIFFLWLMFSAAMAFGADYKNPAFMGYLVVVVCAGLILNWRSAIVWSAFCIFTNAIILYLGQTGILPSSDNATPPIAFWVAQTVYIIVSTILLSQTLRKIDQSFANAQFELNERKRVEAEREKFIAELESKNAELERFTYTVSHDLKSPLITIGGYLGLLEKDAKNGNGDRVEKDIMRIREATAKMQELLNDLLELSRIGRLMNPPETLSFEAIIHDALSLVDGRLFKKNIEVIIQKNLPDVHGDRMRLVEAMQNLLDNAAKFVSPKRTPKIEIGARESQSNMIFFVKDNGIGVDPAHHERIFGLFNKLDSESEGTGVGLALVKRTIEVHGGRIWIESDSSGATFCFTLAEKT